MDIIHRQLNPNPDEFVVNIPLSTAEHGLWGRNWGRLVHSNWLRTFQGIHPDGMTSGGMYIALQTILARWQTPNCYRRGLRRSFVYAITQHINFAAWPSWGSYSTQVYVCCRWSNPSRHVC
jgi:hypothetical protein